MEPSIQYFFKVDDNKQGDYDYNGNNHDPNFYDYDDNIVWMS